MRKPQHKILIMKSIINLIEGLEILIKERKKHKFTQADIDFLNEIIQLLNALKIKNQARENADFALKLASILKMIAEFFK